MQIILKHDNNPKDLTAFYVDCSIEPLFAEERLIRHFELSDDDVEYVIETLNIYQ